MEFEKISLSNNDCKSKENLYGIILAGGWPRKSVGAEPPISEPHLPGPFAKFIDNQSMFELTLRRAKKVISPKRIFLVVNRTDMAVAEARAQVSDRAQPSIVWQPRCSDTVPSLFAALMRIYHRCPDATVAIFPVDHFVAPECRFLSHLRLAWNALKSEGEGSGIILMGMEPHSLDPSYCYIVPERKAQNPHLEFCAMIALVGQAPNRQTAQKLIDRGALWHSGIMVAKCDAVIDVIRRALPVLDESYPIIAQSSDSLEESDRFEKICLDLPAISFAEILRTLSWEQRRRLRVLPVRGVYWSELSDSHRREECLAKMIGTAATTRLASAVT